LFKSSLTCAFFSRVFFFCKTGALLASFYTSFCFLRNKHFMTSWLIVASSQVYHLKKGTFSLACFSQSPVSFISWIKVMCGELICTDFKAREKNSRMGSLFLR